jgi:hypothetical protein
MDECIEQKYIFVAQEQDGVLEWLSHCLVPDSQFYCGSIFSIYYDTPDLDLYYEKRNSDYLKAKVRLRWYSDSSRSTPEDKVTCYLELKRKYGVLRQKNRIAFSLNSRTLTDDPFSEEQIATAPLRIHELLYSPPGMLVPILLIQYKRYRFVDPQTGSRIALDSDIQCAHVNSRYIVGFPPVHLDVGVLEIKGAQRHLLSPLKGISSYLTRETFSKYARCCEHLMMPLSRRI